MKPEPQQEQYADHYTSEIIQDYKEKIQKKGIKNLFVALHSDTLNLEIVSLTTNQSSEALKSKSVFNHYSMMMEIRGEVTSESQLRAYLESFSEETKKKVLSEIGTLLVVDKTKMILLKPTRISKVLIDSSLHPEGGDPENCYLERYKDSKIFVYASEIITAGETLKLTKQSLQEMMYAYET